MSDMLEDDQERPGGEVARPPEADADAEAVVELLPETAAEPPGSPTDAALDELKTEVLSAVRGAITGVMSRHQPALPQPEFDLDFSLRGPEPPAAEPAEPADAIFGDPSAEAFASLAPIEVGEPMLPATTSRAWAAPEQSLAVATRSSILALASRPWPAWTTAALLSVTGVALGAGAAFLLIDPHATASIEDRVTRNFKAAIAVLAGNDTPSGRPAPETVASEADGIAGMSSEPTLAASKSLHSDPITIGLAGPAGTSNAREPVVLLANSATAAASAETGPSLAEPDLSALVRSVQVATAADTAAFADTVKRPIRAGALAAAGGQVPGLEILAALPPQADVTVPAATGTEPSTASASIDRVKDPAQAAKLEPPAEAEPAAPATPLSPMARANAALQSGDVDTARMLLQSESEAGQVEAMLLLARSYDPGYLKLIGVPVAKGNVEAAEKLYRAWYERSVALGLISEGVNLNRLIRAMANTTP